MLYCSLAPGSSLDQGAVFEKNRFGVLSWPRHSQVDVERRAKSLGMGVVPSSEGDG
jgi:hypothetical protein